MESTLNRQLSRSPKPQRKPETWTMKNRLTPLFLALSLSASVATMSLAPVEALAGPATDVVKAKQAQLFEKIRASDEAAVLALLDEMLDYGAIAKASLGDQWGALSGAEQSEFQGLLTRLVQQAYKKNLKKILNFDIDYVSEDASGDVTKVKTKAKNRSERERQAEVDKVSGVFTGSFAKHPFSGADIPVWVGDYVLGGYGTGASSSAK